MNQSIISQRYINKRRVARRLDGDIHPSMMTNFNNLSMSRPKLQWVSDQVGNIPVLKESVKYLIPPFVLLFLKVLLYE